MKKDISSDKIQVVLDDSTYLISLKKARGKFSNLKIKDGEIILSIAKNDNIVDLEAFIKNGLRNILRHISTNLLYERTKINFENNTFYLYGFKRKFLVEKNKLTIYSLFETFQYDLIQNTKTEIKQIIENFFELQLSKTIHMLNRNYLDLINVQEKYKGFSIKKVTSYWGKCKFDGNLIYNLYLICFPLETIESVVVHELSHLIHFNHSEKFYNLVNKIYPSYKNSQKYLEQKRVKKIWKKQ
ncbi:M48 family metallopeptidase [Mycoplasma zalophi]|uniref:M48 family metallopeptidase n=1 Tax=Mycoplasma zalophi TaxID=191287 RepID=UPI0021C81BF0|nr:M48 family metallopeptidase [Mycoplasma zalophi]MCU4117179.1 M48 family metallopeptidase [Mycoplasma zalophi]